MARPTTYVVTGIIFILAGVTIGWFVFPHLIHSKISDAKSLKKGNENRKFWTKAPFAIDFKFFLWNVTNVEEIYKGAKPVVQEVGPFVYNEWKEKANVNDNAAEDTITFQMLNTFYFDKERTLPLTGEENVIIPHMLILTLAQVLLVQKPSALAMLNKGIPHLFSNPTSAFITTTPREILFDGITVNCTKSKEFAANTLCDEIRKNPKGLKVEEDGTFKFSVFGLVNATPNENLITVKRGMKDVKEVGQVILYNGKTKQEIWGADECNAIKGTDTTIFAPFIDTEHPPDLWSFGAEVCRSLPAVYKEPATYKGIKGLVYTADLGDMSNDPHLKCFCPTNSTCLKKGAFDVTKCTGAPVILTLPHCLECHADYLNSVSGYNPVWEKHGIQTIMEPVTGNPVMGYRRLQFNMWIFKVAKIDILKELPEPQTLVPIFWLEEGFALNETLATKFRHLLYRPTKIVNIAKYVFIVGGILCLCQAILFFYKKSKLNPDEESNTESKTNVTQVSPAY